MSLPQLMTKSQVLEAVKNKLAENPNYQVIEQLPYTENSRGLPSLKTLSFIFYKDVENQEYMLVKTSGLNIEDISIKDFKAINSSSFGLVSSIKIQKFNQVIDSFATNEKKLKP